MKNNLNCAALCLLWWLWPVFVWAQDEVKVPLDRGWKFMIGDNTGYSSPVFDDASWKQIQVDKVWEEQGYDPYDGFAWFRVRVVIPEELKANSFLKDSLRICLGKINNFDQTFLNGFLIGSNAKNIPPGGAGDSLFIKAPTRMYNVERSYTLSVNDPRILWGKENVIAVRVYDEGGLGGLYSGHEFIAMTELKEYLANTFAENAFSFTKTAVGKEFALVNTSAGYTIPGAFLIMSKNALTGQEKVIMNTEVLLLPGSRRNFSVVLPRESQSVTLTYTFEFAKDHVKLVNSETVPYILTPEPPSSPRINGPAVTGVRPGSPFLFAVAATGKRPMTFTAEGLPAGLTMDRTTGIISGTVSKPGEYKVSLGAKNREGETKKVMRIIAGDLLALTPPMGWNSWNCWGLTVDQQKVLTSAHAFINKGLAGHGWNYINIDDGWEIKGDSKDPHRDPQGNILTNSKFPDMKALGDSIHRLGLRLGIYSSPGPLTCGGYTASYQHEDQDARSFASWGIDYLKYDWCSYENIGNKNLLDECRKPYILMGENLKKLSRDIVYSLCQYGNQDVWKWGAEVNGNLWRTTGDITDTWESMSGIGFSQVDNAPYAKPGRWNDPDMLVVGWVGWGPDLHPTNLTADEQYTHISLWCLLSAPLLIGCDLARLDEFTLNLLTNDEVLALDQDPLGKQATPKIKSGNIQVWVKELSDGSLAVGIFNLGPDPEKYTLSLPAIGISGNSRLRDLWRQRDMGVITDTLETVIPSHGVILIRQVKP
jgi:alpha-galactosidase